MGHFLRRMNEGGGFETLAGARSSPPTSRRWLLNRRRAAAGCSTADEPALAPQPPTSRGAASSCATLTATSWTATATATPPATG